MKIIITVLMSCYLLLTGCAAFVVAGATTAGLIVYDKRSVKTIEQDTKTIYLIKRAIMENALFDQSRIVVSCFNGVVLLVGQAPQKYLLKQTEKIAYQTPHVRRVYDEMTINYPLDLQTRANDSWLTSQVRTQMLAKKGLESGSIRVVSENSVVYLMGIVTKEQARLATQVARQTYGVYKVVKIFQYLK